MLSMDDKRYRIKEADWELFIKSFDGFDCNQMCNKYFPTKETIDLFQNPNSSLVYCRWCSKS